MKENNGGIGFFGMLTILFIALKLIGVINWGWFWILTPFWSPIVVLILLIIITKIE